VYRHTLTAEMLDQRVIGIVRTDDPEAARQAATTMIEAGLHTIEITLTVPTACDVIRDLRNEHSDALIGAGTVLDAAAASRAIDAGARFLVSPGTTPAVATVAHRHGLPVILGGASVSELISALEAGADAVKLFPARSFSPKWLTDVLAVLPRMPIVPTGGISPESAMDWIRAGAAACGLGSSLTKGSKDIARKQLSDLLLNLSHATA
jgi:2-dehydro-3-deoxyphosphogluconate aldolase/(4S)-4-hydroxy-2-oxoglutarate aldolase